MKYNLYNQEPEDKHKIVTDLKELEKEVTSPSTTAEDAFLNEVHELLFDENLDTETTGY